MYNTGTPSPKYIPNRGVMTLARHAVRPLCKHLNRKQPTIWSTIASMVDCCSHNPELKCQLKGWGCDRACLESLRPQSASWTCKSWRRRAEPRGHNCQRTRYRRAFSSPPGSALSADEELPKFYKWWCSYVLIKSFLTKTQTRSCHMAIHSSRYFPSDCLMYSPNARAEVKHVNTQALGQGRPSFRKTNKST